MYICGVKEGRRTSISAAISKLIPNYIKGMSVGSFEYGFTIVQKREKKRVLLI